MTSHGSSAGTLRRLCLDPLTAELPLQKLEVKAAKVEADVDFLTSVLRRCPHLTSLHVAGMRVYPCSSQRQLLTTVSGNVSRQS